MATEGKRHSKREGAESTRARPGDVSLQRSPVAATSATEDALENLRGYLLFLERMDAKYGHGPTPQDRERRVRRAVDAAFTGDVDSASGGR